MKNSGEAQILRLVAATGIASVVAQLAAVREFLTLFYGNEIVIALILFNWLALGATGTFLAHGLCRRWLAAGKPILGYLSLVLVILAPLTIIGARLMRDVIFLQGASAGFYAVLLFSFLCMAPLSLLVGFVLPYSLFVIRQGRPGFSGTVIYLVDNIGDVSGGALFSFGLILFLTPLKALALANLPLLLCAVALIAGHHRKSALLLGTATFGILIAAAAFETDLLSPGQGRLIHYRESRYGRIEVRQDREQVTLFMDGAPAASSQDPADAEESIHYPLSQLDSWDQILVIGGLGGMMQEIAKYRPPSVDYVELDPAVTDAQLRYGLIRPLAGLHILHADARAYLSATSKRYDAIIVNLPQPDTYQVNRFFTEGFFKIAKEHLTPQGILSFSMEGYDNYLSPAQRGKLSTLLATVRPYFANVLLLPANRVYFLCRSAPLSADIPALLAARHIDTLYIKGFFYGNLTSERIESLRVQLDLHAPPNRDVAPRLMTLVFYEWFEKFGNSPRTFVTVLGALCLIYLVRIRRPEFVLFSTGCLTMGSELLVIFAFQIYFGYIYYQIGLIVTVFLAGLLPGAWIGQRWGRRGRHLLVASDVALIALLGAFLAAMILLADRLPPVSFLLFGFAMSFGCGFQFPLALHLAGDDNASATRSFSADLIGAAMGTLLISLVLIPYFGLLWAGAGLITLKIISLAVIGSSHANP